jgi:4-amino-4-deoxy-L-arabinose transferase-like glycosyltransferase
MTSTPESRGMGRAVVAAASLLFVTGLGTTDLWAPDEPRYAQVAEEMRSGVQDGGGALLLRLHGEVYTQKPPLYYWLAAAIGSTTGRVSETAARLPSALAGIGCVWLTWRLGVRLFPGGLTGAWAAALLLSLPRFAHQARRAQLDVLLTLCETLALFAFWRLESGTDAAPAERRRLIASLHAALGLAALTKGPVGWLPGLGIAAYLAWCGRLREGRALLPAWGLAISIGPLLAWAAAAAWLAPPGWLADAVGENLFARFATGTAHVRPFYYFGYQLPLDFLPWTLLWPLAAVAARRALRARRTLTTRAADPTRLLVACCAVPLVFFSLSAGKRGLYLLPIFPLLALLCGAGVEDALARRGRLPRPLLLVLTGACTLPALVAGAWQAGWLPHLPRLALAPPALWIPTLAAIAAGLCLALAVLRSPRQRLASLVAAFVALELSAFLGLYPSLDSEKSPRPLSEVAASLTPAQETIAVYRENALSGGIAYYSGRRVVNLETLSSVREHVQNGGRVVITGVREQEPLSAIAPFEVRGRSRSGHRELLLLWSPRAAESPPSGG